MPFKGCRVVPFEGLDIECAARVLFQRLGRSERTDGRRQVVVPRAGVCIVLFVIKGVIFAQFQTLFGFEECDAVNLTAGQKGRALHRASVIHRRNPIDGL